MGERILKVERESNSQKSTLVEHVSWQRTSTYQDKLKFTTPYLNFWFTCVFLEQSDLRLRLYHGIVFNYLWLANGIKASYHHSNMKKKVTFHKCTNLWRNLMRKKAGLKEWILDGGKKVSNTYHGWHSESRLSAIRDQFKLFRTAFWDCTKKLVKCPVDSQKKKRMPQIRGYPENNTAEKVLN